MAMIKSMLVLLLLAAQSASTSAAIVRMTATEHAESNLRIQSNSSMFKTFQQTIWNNRVSHAMQHELEMVKADPPHVSKISYVLFAMLFGICGCDRCFMGQILLGCLKGFTMGGFFVWHILDYTTCVISAFTSAEKIDMMGYHATFQKDSITPAFYVALFLVFYQLFNIKNSRDQYALQKEQQAKMIEAMMAEQQQQQQSQSQSQGEAPEKPDSKQTLDIPMRQQSMAFMPTVLTKGLRKAGIVNEKPSVPELIAAFDVMDKNGDGQLDHEEIKEGMKALGMDDEAIDEMIKAADTDGDGKISKNEFLVSYHMKSEN